MCRPTTFLIFFTLLMVTQTQGADMIKEPNVSGQFYDSDPKRLSDQVINFISQAAVQPFQQNIDVIVVPHAGHVYSGPIAGYAYKAVSQHSYKTVILLGPTHYYNFDGVSIWPEGGFKTPLGTVSVDTEFAKGLMAANKNIQYLPQIFEVDHVLEVELPFLQTIFKDAKIVPMIMSRSNDRKTIEGIAETIYQQAKGRDDVLLLISSDLSHFHDENTAHSIDQRGLSAVQEMDVEKLWAGHEQGVMEIDGFKEVIIGVLYAQKRGNNKAELLRYATSADVTGDRNRVVGYSAVVMYKK